jgi:hypothetical protein
MRSNNYHILNKLESVKDLTVFMLFLMIIMLFNLFVSNNLLLSLSLSLSLSLYPATRAKDKHSCTENYTRLLHNGHFGKLSDPGCALNDTGSALSHAGCALTDADRADKNNTTYYTLYYIQPYLPSTYESRHSYLY